MAEWAKTCGLASARSQLRAVLEGFAHMKSITLAQLAIKR